MTKCKKQKFQNLTPLQITALKVLKNSKNFVVKWTDRNLGPAIMDASSFTEQDLKEHLLSKDYQQLSPTESKHKMGNYKQILSCTTKIKLSKAEVIYFQRGLQQ
jgi:hypothetical protein